MPRLFAADLNEAPALDEPPLGQHMREVLTDAGRSVEQAARLTS